MAYTENSSKVADYKIIISTQSIIDLFNKFSEENQKIYSIAGLVFFPLTYPAIPSQNVSFHCWGIRVALAIWKGNNPESLDFYGADPFDPFKIRAVLAPKESILLQGVDTYPYNQPGVNITLTENRTQFPPVLPNEWQVMAHEGATTKLRKFVDTVEYDLAFLEYGMCNYLAGIRKVNDTATSYHFEYENSKFYKFPVEIGARGLQFSRAFFEIDVDERDENNISIITAPLSQDLTKWRTLKVNPWPIPKILTYLSRPSAAYHITPVCPPGWMPNAANYTASRILPRLANRAQQLGWIREIPPQPLKPI